MPVLWLFAYLVVERFFELHLSNSHISALRSKGGREFYPETFPRMIALHTLFLLALLFESYPWQFPAAPYTKALLVMFALLQVGRYWCIASLGKNWNTRIVLVPGGSARKTGLYRFIPHPNYLIVTLEFLILPLLLHTPYTFILFFPANLLVLRQRIRLEESALREFTNYAELFPASKS